MKYSKAALTILAMAMVLCCGALGLESANVKSSADLQTDGGLFLAGTGASASNLLGDNVAAATASIYAATPGSASYLEKESIEQNGGFCQSGTTAETVAIMAGKSISGGQIEGISQVGAVYSTADATEVADLSAKKNIRSMQLENLNGYGSDTANDKASTILIADSKCGDVFGSANINVNVDPRVIVGKENIFMDVSAGRNAYLGTGIRANLGATQAIINDADADVIVKSGKDTNVNMDIWTNERLWGNNPLGLAVSDSDNSLNVAAGRNLNADLDAFGVQTTGWKATTFGSSDNFAAGLVGHHATVNEDAGTVHYIV